MEHLFELHRVAAILAWLACVCSLTKLAIDDTYVRVVDITIDDITNHIAALTLTQGHVLIPFGTIAESASTARGWLIAVDAATWCSTVTGWGGGIWHSGAGPAVGSDGSIFVITGNGSFGPQKGDFDESIVQLMLRTGLQAA